MGGVILLNAVGETNLYTRLVIDSSPGRISDLGCPERYDPMTHLPNDAKRWMIISGGQDHVVPPEQMIALIQAARSRGARIVGNPEFAHPFQDPSKNAFVVLDRMAELRAWHSVCAASMHGKGDEIIMHASRLTILARQNPSRSDNKTNKKLERTQESEPD